MQKRILNLLVFGIIIFTSSCKKFERDYYPSGSLKFEVIVKNGKREGKSILFYESGEKQIISHWHNGLKEGESISYFKNGQINIKANYKSNKANGSVFLYDSLGNLLEKYEVKDDLKHGEYLEYFPSGAIRVEGSYYNDLAHGHGVEYYENGSLFRKYFYQKDSLVYFKGFDQEGYLYDCVLPIEIDKIEKDEVIIKLTYSEYDNVRIGVIIGNLNNKGHLKDTIEVLGSKGLELRYKLKPDQKHLEGKLFEIKMPEDEISGEYFFKKTFAPLSVD